MISSPEIEQAKAEGVLSDKEAENALIIPSVAGSQIPKSSA